MASAAELATQIRELSTRFNELEAKLDQVLRVQSPQCFHCGSPAAARKRISIGRARMQMDVWLCSGCQKLESAKDV